MIIVITLTLLSVTVFMLYVIKLSLDCSVVCIYIGLLLIVTHTLATAVYECIFIVTL